MTKYNNTEEYNGIHSGDTVFISGLLGKHYSFINNKYGYIKDIYLSSKNDKISYIGEIVLFSTNETHFVNFDYIFKIGKNLNNQDAKSMIWTENPFTHFINKKNLVSFYPIVDEHGQILTVSTDKNNYKHVFLYSGIN